MSPDHFRSLIYDYAHKILKMRKRLRAIKPSDFRERKNIAKHLWPRKYVVQT